MTRSEMLEQLFDGWTNEEIQEILDADMHMDDFADAWDELTEIYEKTPCVVHDKQTFSIQ
jgi:hypothetical protein